MWPITDDQAVKYAVEPADIAFIFLNAYILTISYLYRRWKRRDYKAEGRCNGVWTDMALEKTYNRDAKTKLFTGISQQSTAMEKYLQALLMLTAVSEQTKVMAHLNPNEPKHSLDSNSQSGKEDACTKQIIEVIKNQMIDRFRCEQK